MYFDYERSFYTNSWENRKLSLESVETSTSSSGNSGSSGKYKTEVTYKLFSSASSGEIMFVVLLGWRYYFYESVLIRPWLYITQGQKYQQQIQNISL